MSMRYSRMARISVDRDDAHGVGRPHEFQDFPDPTGRGACYPNVRSHAPDHQSEGAAVVEVRETKGADNPGSPIRCPPE